MKRTAVKFILLGWALFFSACAPDQKVAEVINGWVVGKSLADATPATGGRANDLNSSVSCSGKSHAVYGGTLETKICEQTIDKDGKTYCPISIIADVVFQQARDTFPEQKLSCILSATWEVDPATEKFIGPGVIETCDVLNYKCTLGTTKIRCESLQAALKQFPCS